MTKSELYEMIEKLQAEAASLPDDPTQDPSTTGTNAGQASKTEAAPGNGPEDKEAKQPAEKKEPEKEPELNKNGDVEEKKQLDPQTNGTITDNVVPGVLSTFEEPTTATETAGVEQVLQANFDERIATITRQYAGLLAEMDKMKVALSQIMTRIDLVQEVTDKVTTVDHDSLLSESIKLLV